MVSQVGRFVRLFSIGFGGALLASANATGIHGHLTSKAVLAAVVAAVPSAFEVAYRGAFPATGQGRVALFVAAVRAAYAQGKTNGEPKRLLIVGQAVADTPKQ